MTQVLVLLSPGILSVAAAAMLWLRPAAPPGRFLVVVSIVAGVLVAVGGPSGFADAPGLLLGVRARLDLLGRLSLLVAAGGMLAAMLDRRADRDPGGTLAWRVLVAGGLAFSAVASDAGTLAVGFIALVAGAYGLAAGRPGARRAAAAFVVVAVLGEVLLVDALAEYGHAAESARLDAMRVAAEAELAGMAPLLLLAGAYGLPLALVAVRGPLGPAFAFAAAGVMALARLHPGPDVPPPAEGVAALAVVALAGGLLVRLLVRWPRFAPDLPAHGPAVLHEVEHAEEPAPAPSPRLARVGRALARAEAWLVAVGASGVVLALVLAAFALALAAR